MTDAASLPKIEVDGREMDHREFVEELNNGSLVLGIRKSELRPFFDSGDPVLQYQFSRIPRANALKRTGNVLSVGALLCIPVAIVAAVLIRWWLFPVAVFCWYCLDRLGLALRRSAMRWLVMQSTW